MKNIFTYLSIFLPCMLLSCKTEVAQKNSFDTIMMQDSFYKTHPAIEKKFLSKQIGSDSLWIIQLISNDEIVTRGYVNNTDFILTILDTADVSGYRGDTLFDANFDGIKDYIINYYSGTGCCPRKQNRVFLFDTTEHIFLPKIEMLNTYFDHKNKTVLSMDYGYPAVHMGISLSKNKWKQDSLVILEDITFGEDSSLWLHFYDTGKDLRLTGLPDDYKHIPQADWFTLK